MEAKARTRASRILHGGWLLLFAVALPQVLEVVPLAALAGVLLHAGWKLLPARVVAALWRTHRGEAVVLVVTAVSILATRLFEGVLVGLGLAVAKAAWETSHVHVEEVWEGEELCVRIVGNASFLRLPKLLASLEALPHGPSVRLDLSGLRHLDHACLTALESWERKRTPLPGREGVVQPGCPPAGGHMPSRPEALRDRERLCVDSRFRCQGSGRGSGGAVRLRVRGWIRSGF